MYRVPSTTRTHFEIMSEAVIEREKEGDSEPFFIKFDFTSAGYRMIYEADEDAGA